LNPTNATPNPVLSTVLCPNGENGANAARLVVLVTALEPEILLLRMRMVENLVVYPLNGKHAISTHAQWTALCPVGPHGPHAPRLVDREHPPELERSPSQQISEEKIVNLQQKSKPAILIIAL